MFQQLKNRKVLYGYLTPKNTAELKLWDTVHVDLISLYRKSIVQQHPGVATTKGDASITCIKMINPKTGWFEIFKVPTFYLDKVTGGNYEYIDD